MLRSSFRFTNSILSLGKTIINGIKAQIENENELSFKSSLEKPILELEKNLEELTRETRGFITVIHSIKEEDPRFDLLLTWIDNLLDIQGEIKRLTKVNDVFERVSIQDEISRLVEVSESLLKNCFVESLAAINSIGTDFSAQLIEKARTKIKFLQPPD